MHFNAFQVMIFRQYHVTHTHTRTFTLTPA